MEKQKKFTRNQKLFTVPDSIIKIKKKLKFEKLSN